MNELKRQRIKKKYRQLFSHSSWNVSFSDSLDEEIDLIVYIVHVGTGLIKLIGLCNQKDGKSSTLSFDRITNQTGELIRLYATNNYSHMLTEKEMLGLLGSSVGEYVKHTHSYKVALELAGSETPRMVVMHMDDPLDNNAFYVRPNPLPVQNFSGEDIQHVARLIIDQDKLKHPERFKSADILDFKAKKVEI